MSSITAQESLRIAAVDGVLIDDLIRVCSPAASPGSPLEHGILMKKQWLRRMLEEFGSVAKIGYLDGKPIAQLLYYPEKADPTKRVRRKRAVFLHCIYNPSPEAQRKGLGTQLYQRFLREVSSPMSCFGGEPAKFVHAAAFNTGEFLPLPAFYGKLGFKHIPDGGNQEMYLPVAGRYEKGDPPYRYEPLAEDRGRAIVFYSPSCQFSYVFATRAADVVNEIDPKYPVELIDRWEKPDEYLRRCGNWLIVNARPIRSSLWRTDKFREDMRTAMRRSVLTQRD